MQVRKNASVLAGLFIEKGYKVVSGGTDNHLMLIDLRTKFADLTGKVAEKELVKADITVNKNMVPFDTRTPFSTSGIRIGTPAVTSRGLVDKDMPFIANLVDEVLALANDNLDLIKMFPTVGLGAPIECEDPALRSRIDAYEEHMAEFRKQVRMKMYGLPLNRY